MPRKVDMRLKTLYPFLHHGGVRFIPPDWEVPLEPVGSCHRRKV